MICCEQLFLAFMQKEKNRVAPNVKNFDLTVV